MSNELECQYCGVLFDMFDGIGNHEAQCEKRPRWPSDTVKKKPIIRKDGKPVPCKSCGTDMHFKSPRKDGDAGDMGTSGCRTVIIYCPTCSLFEDDE